MFLCEKCHEKDAKKYGCAWWKHLFYSLGRCEDCGRSGTCADCTAYRVARPTDAEAR